MPNYCTGFMNVRGYAPNVDEFLKILQADYSYHKDSNNHDYSWCLDPKNFSHIPHFFRVFEAYKFDEKWNSGVYKCISVDFTCAWSVSSCMLGGPWSYYFSFEKDHPGEHYGSTLLIESKRLQLEIELWSYEPGMVFQEHYKICSGIMVKEEVLDFAIMDIEGLNTYDEFKAKYPNAKTTKEEFEERVINEDPWIEELNEEEVDFLPGDDPEYLARIVMVKKVEEK